MQHSLWSDIIHTNSESATNMMLTRLSILVRQCSAVQGHAVHRYMLACPLQVCATCPGTWWTRLTHPEPPPMPPPTHRQQKLTLVLVLEYRTPGFWSCGFSSEGPCIRVACAGYGFVIRVSRDKHQSVGRVCAQGMNEG